MTNKTLDIDSLLQFNQELLGIVRSGIPLDQGLNVAASEIRSGNLRHALEKVETSIKQGASLSQALSQAQSFPLGYVSLIAVGERLGSLTGILEQLITQYRRQVQFRQLVKTTFFYPVSVLILGFLLFMFACVFILPKFAGIYRELGAELPPLTLAILNIADFFVQWWAAILLIAVAVIAFLVNRSFSKNILSSDWLLLKHIPLTSRLYRYQNSATFCSAMGMLMGQGVSASEALYLTRMALISDDGRRQVDAAIDKLEKGSSLADSLAEVRFLSALPTAMLRLASDRPDLPQAMLSMADYFEMKLGNLRAQIGRVLEPLLVLILGLIIGITIISLYLPLFNITRAMGG